MLQALDTVETVNRLIDLFPSHERAWVRAMLADMLKGITGQRLMQTKDDKSQVTACEIMSATGRIKDFIMDAYQTGQI
jgi:twitching motility protein PilT